MEGSEKGHKLEKMINQSVSRQMTILPDFGCLPREIHLFEEQSGFRGAQKIRSKNNFISVASGSSARDRERNRTEPVPYEKL